MFYFAIPLISKRASRDWGQVESLLNGTLGSILNSTSQNYQILIACHDVPNTQYNNSNKIKYLQAEFPPLMGQNRPMLDKIFKLKMIGLEIRKNTNNCFIMLTDADDLVSNKLVEYVNIDQDNYGYYIYKGYELEYSLKRLRYCPRYHRLCGSSIILRISESDLPVSLDQKEEDNYFNKMIYAGHRYCEPISKSLNRPLKKIPFAAGVYIINNGENHSALTNNIGIRRRIVRALTPTFPLNNKIQNEFGINF
jgi:hypothetical protein